MLTQLLFANKLLLDYITEQRKKAKQKQTPSALTCLGDRQEDATWFLLFLKTDLPLRPGHRSVNNVNESTFTSCHRSYHITCVF